MICCKQIAVHMTLNKAHPTPSYAGKGNKKNGRHTLPTCKKPKSNTCSRLSSPM